MRASRISPSQPKSKPRWAEANANRGPIAAAAANLARISPLCPQRFPRRSALENVSLSLLIRGEPQHAAQEESMRWLDELGLASKAGESVERLSGGERQRVAIARALVGSPPILLADEPTSQLDAHWARKVMELFSDQTGRGAVVLLATHDPLFLEDLAHRRVRISEGRLEEGS